MQRSKVSFHNSLGGRMFLFGIVPTGLVLVGVVLVTAWQLSGDLHASSEETLGVLAERVATEIERGNTRAVLMAEIMAEAQARGMFGDREQSSEFARRVLSEHPELTGAYFGYEPNADGKDAAYLESDAAEQIGPAFDPQGRFIPYWFRDKADNSRLVIEPLVDMETSLYYQGCKELFEQAGRPVPQVTEPYVYEGKMIVEQTFPIVIDNDFKGIAGVDRALSDIVSFLDRLGERDQVDLFLISREGKFVASTMGEVSLEPGKVGDLRTLKIAETPYRNLFSKIHDQRKTAQLLVEMDPILGERCYFAAAPVPTGDWLVIVREPEARVLAPIRAQTTKVLGAVAGALILVTLLSWWTIHKTTTRIRSAVAAADALATGNLASELKLQDTSRDEAGSLVESFNQLVVTYRGITGVCRAIAEGDFSKRLEKRSADDELVDAINQMAEARQQAEGRINMLLNTAPVGLLLVDDEGVIRSANEEAERLFGYDSGELNGKSVDTLVPEMTREQHVQMRDAFFADPDRKIMAKERELKAVRKDGTEIFAELGLAPLELPEGLMVAAAIHDISDRMEAEQALRKSEERFDLTVRGSGDGLWDHDPATGELWYADRFRELLGYSSEEEYPNVVESWSDGLHPDDRKATLDAFAAHLERDVPYDVEYRLKTKTGEYRWFRARGMSLRDETGRSYRAAGSISDTTDQKLAEEGLAAAEERSRLLLESTHEGIVGVNTQGVATFVNSSAATLLGYQVDEILGKRVHPLFHHSYADKSSYPEEACPMHHACTDGETAESVEEALWRNDGSGLLAEYSATPIRDADGELMGAVIVFRDIAERKQAESDLAQAKEAAEAATQAKSDFLANMSHEIRTPMNGVIGMTDLTLDTDLTSEQRDYLNTVKSSADALLSLIDDILDFSKIEAGKLELEPIDFALRDALADMLNTLANRAHTKGLELLYEVPPNVHDILTGDVYRVRQIIVNLVGNAIKFTERGEIAVSVEQVERTDQNTTLHFSVRDTGIGIPPDKLDAVFKPFSQADVSTTRRYGGTGLGLAISVQLVELMGGRIWAESNPGQGSTFHFTAKFGLGQASPKLESQINRELLDGLPVLVVDDNATNRRILEEMLRNWQMAPESVAGAAAALAALDRAANAGVPYRLILSDVNMPEMDGFMLFESTRSNSQHRDVPFVLLTSAARPGDMARCREIGVSAHLIKPVKQSLLLNAIASAVAGKDIVAKPHATTAAASTPKADRSLQVLLAEDNEVNQKFAVRAIEKAGHAVVVANNGLEAVNAWERERFDVVLMDVQMPELDGFGATARIRELEQQRGTAGSTPIIAMTANAMKGDKERCLEAGMDGYVSKPVKRQTLFAEIDRVLGTR